MIISNSTQMCLPKLAYLFLNHHKIYFVKKAL